MLFCLTLVRICYPSVGVSSLWIIWNGKVLLCIFYQRKMSLQGIEEQAPNSHQSFKNNKRKEKKYVFHHCTANFQGNIQCNRLQCCIFIHTYYQYTLFFFNLISSVLKLKCNCTILSLHFFLQTPSMSLFTLSNL